MVAWITLWRSIRLTPKAWNEDLILIKEKIETVSTIRFNSVLLNDYEFSSDKTYFEGISKVKGILPSGANGCFFENVKLKKHTLDNKTKSEVNNFEKFNIKSPSTLKHGILNSFAFSSKYLASLSSTIV